MSRLTTWSGRQLWLPAPCPALRAWSTHDVAVRHDTACQRSLTPFLRSQPVEGVSLLVRFDTHTAGGEVRREGAGRGENCVVS